MISKHPFEPYIPNGATKLIIGTIPPPRFCKNPFGLNNDDVNFYYGSKDNSFWSLLEDVYDVKLKYKNDIASVNQRKELLKHAGIGITDIIKECVHENDLADDESLKDISQKNIQKLLIEYPQVTTLIYTSEFVKKEIRKQFNLSHKLTYRNKRKQTLNINGKEYQVRILYSPSPLALINMGTNGDEKRKHQYQEFLIKD